jgi:hypothetical protein
MPSHLSDLCHDAVWIIQHIRPIEHGSLLPLDVQRPRQ